MKKISKSWSQIWTLIAAALSVFFWSAGLAAESAKPETRFEGDLEPDLLQIEFTKANADQISFWCDGDDSNETATSRKLWIKSRRLEDAEDYVFDHASSCLRAQKLFDSLKMGLRSKITLSVDRWSRSILVVRVKK